MPTSSKSYLDTLNPEQKLAVEAVEGPVLILAGAGSGKTRVLTTRIAHLIYQHQIPPYAILAMTFTKKAANEMKERVEHLVEGNAPIWIGTFHSIFAKILRFEAPAYNYSTNFGIYDTTDQARLIKEIMHDQQISPQTYSPKSMSAIISRTKTALITPTEFEKLTNSLPEEIAAKIYPIYQKRLRINQAFDFDDLITVPIHIFKQYPDILQKYQERFQYFLVDEYQDTNKAQYQLIHLLAKANQNLCVVGDDDQSIYKWRGADITNILDFEKDFSNVQVFRLEQNYRSTQNILKAAHSVVKNNKGRKEKKLWSDREDGNKVQCIEIENERAEAYKVVEKIREEVFQHKRSFRDFAILYRTNAQSRALEDGLRRSGMSYIIVGGVRFYERKEIKDLLAYLKLLINPADTISLKRIINLLRGIGETSVVKMENWAAANQVSLFEAIGRANEIEAIASRIQAKILSFHAFITKYQQLLGDISPNELASTLADESGLIATYKENITTEAQERIDNIRELLSAINAYVEETEEPTITGFLEEVALVADVDTWNDNNNAITLMTLHSSKGLEFPVVFIAGLEEGLFPSSRSMDDPETLEEERRLFYVGMTRAQDMVYLLHTQCRSLWGDSNGNMPSRFLSELDEHIIENFPMGGLSKHRATTHRIKQRESAYEDFSQVHPDYESISQEPSYGFKTGMLVQHETFGAGKITKIEGSGAKQKVSVRFTGGVIKKILAKYAKLEVRQ